MRYYNNPQVIYTLYIYTRPNMTNRSYEHGSIDTQNSDVGEDHRRRVRRTRFFSSDGSSSRGTTRCVVVVGDAARSMIVDVESSKCRKCGLPFVFSSCSAIVDIIGSLPSPLVVNGTALQQSQSSNTFSTYSKSSSNIFISV